MPLHMTRWVCSFQVSFRISAVLGIVLTCAHREPFGNGLSVRFGSSALAGVGNSAGNLLWRMAATYIDLPLRRSRMQTITPPCRAISLTFRSKHHQDHGYATTGLGRTDGIALTRWGTRTRRTAWRQYDRHGTTKAIYLASLPAPTTDMALIRLIWPFPIGRCQSSFTLPLALLGDLCLRPLSFCRRRWRSSTTVLRQCAQQTYPAVFHCLRSTERKESNIITKKAGLTLKSKYNTQFSLLDCREL